MRKIFLAALVCLGAFTSCKKDSGGDKASVTYHVQSTNVNSMKVLWANPNGQMDSTIVNGSHWTRTQSVTKPFQSSIGVKVDNAPANAKVKLEISADGMMQLSDSTTNGWAGANFSFSQSITIN